MGKMSKYVAKTPRADGTIFYSEEENAVWHDLIVRQKQYLPGRVHPEWIAALDRLELPEDRVPQCKEVSEVLLDHTGWQVAPVPALIPFTRFFELLSNKQFPAASFIRSRDEFDYLQEPDIFHEIFGHTPMLTDSRFAAFSEAYGRAGLAADKKDHAMLARLYWFTVEFGLINTAKGLRSYGAGINSSPGELVYALESDVPQRKPLDPVDALRTPYRIDIYQTVYFVIDSFDTLFELAQLDLLSLVAKARQLGMHAPTFPPKEQKLAG